MALEDGADDPQVELELVPADPNSMVLEAQEGPYHSANLVTLRSSPVPMLAPPHRSASARDGAPRSTKPRRLSTRVLRHPAPRSSSPSTSASPSVATVRTKVITPYPLRWTTRPSVRIAPSVMAQSPAPGLTWWLPFSCISQSLPKLRVCFKLTKMLYQ
ncbi:MAG: hypothetical protein AVDCRST_MAG93-2220 [uncultured Chloroflexia bacterium]|uniref:Uncharacterized protein n=1 Tax=uncultured Chloroflexia bacterium TaxID=1672391 RepID=A0A6J4IWH4_9CHLR|nr:MAG: hypothetical protein AVDCRST_MAG93-2220 [uncultured Chloroflexia bacterium]